jgi:cell shape-determining protein MreC
MPTKEVNAAIVVLEKQLKSYEKLLDETIANNEILAKAKIILLKLKEVSKELNELKNLEAGNSESHHN